MSTDDRILTDDELKRDLVERGVIRPDETVTCTEAIMRVFGRLSSENQQLVLDIARQLSQKHRTG